MKRCVSCGLLFISLMATVPASCDRETAERGPLSEAQGDQTTQKPPGGAVWVVNPTDPGPDVPTVGRSLFDYVVAEQQGRRTVYRVPFPFTALVRRIERELGSADHDSPLKRVLIPLNRSLQRHAAKPEYFAYPRAVMAVDTEPPMRAGSSGMFLKDRLFVGYQEKAEILEVISYNEAAGRFEFQVVRDYGPGKTPKVFYANRALCTACHQNHSPIFSRPLWDETNANPKIATLLEQQHAVVHRFPLHQGVDVPNAIDEATDRANDLSTYQLFWEEGCEQARSSSDSIQCRADLFRFFLLSRLKGSPAAFRSLSVYRDQFVPRVASQWKEKWPQGLLIPNPDLLNRNPLDDDPSLAIVSAKQAISAIGYGGADERAKIRSIFEPTIFRDALAVWSISPPYDVVDRVVMGLSRFLADVDVERLDTYLFQEATRSGAPLRRYHSRCEAEMRDRGRWVDRITFRCRESEQLTKDHEGGFSMEGVLYLKAGTLIDGTIDRLSASEGDELAALKIAGGTLTSKDGRHGGRIVVTQKDPRLHARMADGHAITELTFQFGVNREAYRHAGGTAGFVGSAAMTVVEDYRVVDRAIDAMTRETLAGESDVFARKPFRRASVMKALSRRLKMPSLIWCCEETHRMPQAVSMTDQAVHDPAAHDKTFHPVFKALHRYCAECHHEDMPFPPNFLHGSPQQVQQQIDHCAERIFFRLAMWNLAPYARQEAPMPPVTALQRLHLSQEQWATHSDLAVLKDYAAELLKARGDKPPRLEDLIAQGYDNLRECLPTSQDQMVSGVFSP